MKKINLLLFLLFSFSLFSFSQHVAKEVELRRDAFHGVEIKDKGQTPQTIKGGEYTLTIEIFGDGAVLVNGIEYEDPIVFDEDEVVNLEAMADEGWMFFEWDGDLTGSEMVETIIMDDDKTISATFNLIPIETYTLTIGIIGEGWVFVNGVLYEEEMEFEEGEELILWATPEMGYEFIEWDVNGIIVVDNPGMLTISEDILVETLFEETLETQYSLTINMEGEGQTFPPAGVYYFMENDVATVMAMEVEGWEFIGWTGDIESEELIEMILMDDDKVVTAHFDEIVVEMFTLTIVVAGEGHVLVDAVEYTAALDFVDGTEVNLEAVADEGWVFVEWAGDLESSEMVETITMDDHKTIHAEFIEEVEMLTLTITISGDGMVNVNGVEYTEVLEFAENEEVTLEAIAAADWTFVGWSGDLESSEINETITMDGHKHITATFESESYFWYNDFSNPADWLIYSNPNTDALWIITTFETAPAGWIPAYGMPETFASTTADNGFAFFNSDMLGCATCDPIGPCYLQFADPIDFSELNGVPMLEFETFYARWDDRVYFEYSLDGGSEWIQIEILTEVERHASNRTPPDYVYSITIPELAGQSNVLFRFNFDGQEWDYAWFIDDVRFIEAPDYNIGIVDSRVHFFEYVDPAEYGPNYFHYSSHYGQIPIDQFNSPSALSWFSVVVRNYGGADVVPHLKIQVTDPDDVIIYDDVFAGSSIGPNQYDTIDVVDIELALEIAEAKIGKYSISFEVFIEGEIEEENTDNNFADSHFYITERTMSRDAQEITWITGPAYWVSGGNDGDALATNYTFLYEDEIESVDIFIDERSDEGTAIIVRLYAWMGSSWVDVTQSTVINIEEEHLGNWLNVKFLHPAIISFPEGQSWLDVRVAIEFYYNEPENELWIGIDDENNNHSFWGAVWYFVEGANAGQWFSITNWQASGLGIRVNTLGTLYDVTFTVQDEDQNPLQGATIAINGQANLTTDGTGKASIELPTGTYTYSVSKADFITQSDLSFTLSDSDKEIDITLISLSIDSHVFSDLNIYPNPTTGHLNIENVEGAQIEFINIMGQTIKTIYNANTLNQVDISNFSKGTYIVRIIKDNEISINKINLID